MVNVPRIAPEQLLPYATLREILADKSTGVVSIEPDASVRSALQLMADRDIGAVVVLEGGRPVGMFSERDYARKLVLAGKASVDTPVRDVMTDRVISVTPAQTVPECMALMTDKRIRHLPVVEDGQILGVLSIGDLMKEMLRHHERLLKQLAVERITLLMPDPSSY